MIYQCKYCKEPANYHRNLNYDGGGISYSLYSYTNWHRVNQITNCVLSRDTTPPNALSKYNEFCCESCLLLAWVDK